MQGSWTECTPETAREFSAVAYYFARELSQKLKVPVGIVQASWSGSTAEEWTSWDSMKRAPELQPIIDRWQQAPDAVHDFAHAGGRFDLQFDSFELLRADNGAPVPFSSFDNRLTDTFGQGFWSTSGRATAPLVSPGNDGTGYSLRFYGTMDLGASPSLRASIPGTDSLTSPDYDLHTFSGIRFQVRGNGCFHTHLEEPIVKDGDVYASERVCAGDTWKPVTLLFSTYKQATWGVPEPLALEQTRAFVIDAEAVEQRAGERPPAGLYNGMIVPLASYTIRGALWYQGEGNSGRAYQYRTLLATLIEDWRALWREGDYPFLIVQLPNLGAPTLNAEESGWAELREAQSIVSRQTSNAGLAVTIDLGEAHNLHPPRKAEIGQRLAMLALGKVYHLPLEYSGPTFVEARMEDRAMRLKFVHADGLAARDGGAVLGFAVAGPDRKFFPATAIISGNNITVSSPSVLHPAAVRYAWAGNPQCNLINGARLPAEPFRTDNWSNTTDSRR